MTSARVNAMSAAFGALIIRYRKQKGWSRQTFSERVGLSLRHVGILENGQNVPSLHTLFRFAALFGVRPSDILREVEEQLTVTR